MTLETASTEPDRRLPTIGLRREDKQGERRAPLSPQHVQELVRDHGVAVRVEPAPERIFPDAEYAAAGAGISTRLDDCGLLLGVKEVALEWLAPERTHAFFSHLIKGQSQNAPLLRGLVDGRCTLVDYEPIVDARGRRLIFFGRQAGHAGMIDALWAYGRRLKWEGLANPFEEIRRANEYADLDEARRHIASVGERIRRERLPANLRPVVVAFAGSGNVCKGAQEVFERLPYQELEVHELAGLAEARERPRDVVFKTVLGRAQRVRRADGGFDEAEYRHHPGRYSSRMAEYLPHLSLLVNGTYWEPGLPTLVTVDQVEQLWRDSDRPKLRVIADISCDVCGSIELTVKTTEADDPVYVYDLDSGEALSGVAGRGPVVLAVDNLPSELPREATERFGDSLLRFVPALASCDWSRSFHDLALPDELHRAVVVHRGSLAPRYASLQQLVKE